MIFYLANAENPIVVQVNTKNDNQQEFDRIVDELQTKRSHNVEPVVDCAKIQEIFNADDLIDDEGKGLYRSVEWTYYVNSTFWALMYNESVIASLFFIMDMEEMIESGYLRVNIMQEPMTRCLTTKSRLSGLKRCVHRRSSSRCPTNENTINQ